MKKVLSVVLAIILTLAVIPSFSVFASQTMSGNFSVPSLSGNLAADVAAVARAQSGRSQSSMGYTESWCADFVCDCAKVAGVSSSVVPWEYSGRGAVGSLYSFMLNACGASVVSSAQAGDFVFYYCTSTGGWCHVGIMTDNINSVHGNIWYPTSMVYSMKYTSFIDSNGSCWTATFVRPNYTRTGTLDVNGYWNNDFYGWLNGIASFDVYINGNLVADDVSDYYYPHPYGSTYSIQDVRVLDSNIEYKGIHEGSLSGTINSESISTVLKFLSKPSTYTVSYNANGGSNAPEAQTKTHDVGLTLSSDIPVLAGFRFLGWATESTATAARYDAGGAYTDNASVTLYALWIADGSQMYYRSRTTETTTSKETSMDGWTRGAYSLVATGSGSLDYVANWSPYFDKGSAMYAQYNHSPISPSETETSKRTVSTSTIGYMYFHYTYDSGGGSERNRFIGQAYGELLENGCWTTLFEAFVNGSALTWNGAAEAYECRGHSIHTYWWLSWSEYDTTQMPVYRCNYTDYDKLYTYTRPSDWSDWSTTPITPNANTEVQTRTLTYADASYAWNGSQCTGTVVCNEDSLCNITETVTGVEQIVSVPNCTRTGEKVLTATFTDTEHFAPQSLITELPATGHRAAAELRNVQQASCNHTGYTGDTYCENCGVILTEGSVLPATGVHSYGAYTVATAATCISTGSKVRICTVCGNPESVEIPVDSSNHTGETTLRGASNATCGVAGYTGDTCCADCGVTLTAGSVLPATGVHSYGAYTVVTAATCISIGSKVRTCTVCGNPESVGIPVDSSRHTGETTLRSAYAATCKTAGYTGDLCCKSCGAVLTAGTTITVKPHSDENRDGFCDYCGEELDSGSSHACDCDCHTTNSFMKFIWKIKVLFWKLFGLEDKRQCECGEMHW